MFEEGVCCLQAPPCLVLEKSTYNILFVGKDEEETTGGQTKHRYVYVNALNVGHQVKKIIYWSNI